MKSLFKNLSLYLLTLILILSSVIPSYAIGGNNNNNNNNSNNVGGGGDFSTSSGKFGLRFSLVYKDDPSTVVSVNDAGEPAVIDMWYCTYAQFNQYTQTNSLTNLTKNNMHSAVKTQTLNERNTITPIWLPDYVTEAEWAQSNESLSAEQKQNIANSSALLKSIPRWLGYESGHYVTYGLQLQDWENANNWSNINELLKIVDKEGRYIFKTKESIDYNNNGSITPVTEKNLPHFNDTVLMIEPLLLFTPCYVGTSTPMMNKQYGTVTNIIEAMWDNPVFKAEYNKNKQMNHLNYKMTDIAWNALNIKVTPYFKFNDNYYLSKFVMYTDAKNHIGTEQSGILNWSVLNETRDWTHFDVDSISANFKNGYALNIFWFSELGNLDINVHSGNPRNSDTPKVDDLIVNRFFRKKNIDGTYTYEKFDTHNYNKNSFIVYLEAQSDSYKLVEWGTSETEKWQASKLETWEEVSKHNTVTEKGNTSKELTIDNNSKIKTINVLYEKSPQAQVIKVYEEDGVTKKVEGPDYITENPYKVPKGEDGYTYEENKKSSNPPKNVDNWSDTEGASGTEPEITIKDNIETVYILYQKSATQKIVLYENELSYNYDLRDLLVNRQLIEIYDRVPAAPYYYEDCPGHDWWHNNDDCDGHTSYCKSRTRWLNDMNWTVAVKDGFNQNSLDFIKDWTYITPLSATGIATMSGGNGTSAKVKPNASYLLIRNKVKDVATLYPKKNNSLLSELSKLNLKENYTSSDTRKDKQRETDKTKKFYDTVHTSLAYTSARDTKLNWATLLSGRRGSHPASENYNTSTETGHSPQDANAAYSQTNNVETRYFLGKAGLGEEKPTFALSDWMKKYKDYNYLDSYTDATLKFYPYLEYTYYYKDNKTGQPVMVTSSNLSTMKVYNAAQIGVYKKNKINANLTSTQWSTHARSLSFLQNHGIDDKKSVLPGGAIQDIDMGNKGDTQIGITLWQACLKNSLVETVQQDGFKVSETEARNGANTLQQEIKKSIAGYGLVQYAMEGVETDVDGVLDSGEELHENTDISFVLGNGGKTSADEKYYLRHEGNGSNRANFDCLDSKIEHQYLYTIKSDTKGNVIVDRDGTELGRISKTQDLSKLLSVPEIKLLDDNTKLVTNFVKCIERNVGTARNGDKWYNEAHDGISVLRTEMSFDVGFSSNNAHRTNVLDPLLTAKANSKSDLYNFNDDENVRTSVYVTTDVSTTADKADKQGYLGTLKGVSGIQDLEITLNNIQKFVHTKNFYIPNATVSDLN